MFLGHVGTSDVLQSELEIPLAVDGRLLLIVVHLTATLERLVSQPQIEERDHDVVSSMESESDSAPSAEETAISSGPACQT